MNASTVKERFLCQLVPSFSLFYVLRLYFSLPVMLYAIWSRRLCRIARSRISIATIGITQHNSPTAVPVAIADGRESDSVQPLASEFAATVIPFRFSSSVKAKTE